MEKTQNTETKEKRWNHKQFLIIFSCVYVFIEFAYPFLKLLIGGSVTEAGKVFAADKVTHCIKFLAIFTAGYSCVVWGYPYLKKTIRQHLHKNPDHE